MQVIISYDISANEARRAFFDKLNDYGFNTQRSVFECEADKNILRELYSFALSIIDKETDSVIIQPVCKRCVQDVSISGQGLKIVDCSFLVM